MTKERERARVGEARDGGRDRDRDRDRDRLGDRDLKQ